MPVTNEGIQQDFCDKCLTVVKHAGTPKGKTIEVAAGSDGAGPTTKHKVYAAIPDEGKYNANEAIIMCTGRFSVVVVLRPSKKADHDYWTILYQISSACRW